MEWDWSSSQSLWYPCVHWPLATRLSQAPDAPGRVPPRTQCHTEPWSVHTKWPYGFAPPETGTRVDMVPCPSTPISFLSVLCPSTTGAHWLLANRDARVAESPATDFALAQCPHQRFRLGTSNALSCGPSAWMPLAGPEMASSGPVMYGRSVITHQTHVPRVWRGLGVGAGAVRYA